MSSFRSAYEASMEGEIANSLGARESSFALTKQGDQRQHHLFRDKSLNAEGSRTRKEHNPGLSKVDMAYRKLGQQLSLRAHGNFVATNHRTSCRIGKGEGSSFAPYNRSSKRTNNIDVGSVSKEIALASVYGENSLHILKGGQTQMTKAAKTRPNDHGNFQKTPFRKRNVLRHLTMNASKILLILQDDMIARSARRPSDSQQQSPQLQPQQNNEPTSSSWLQEDMNKGQLTNEFSNKNRTFLPQKADRAESDTSHSVEILSNRPQHLNFELPITEARDSKRKTSYHSQQSGECLTDPSVPMSNNGFDNANGDLIVYENDIIRVSRNKIHVLSKERMRDVTHVDYRAQRKLGQGTFAQVYQCLHVQTGKLVALKIVKNKAAYARQASVEIDVLRALRTPVGNNGSELTAEQTRAERSSSDSHRGTMSTKDEEGCMVDLVCYFLYKSHLCLAFELLGQNLYDVLKQRNFRGLRLSVVRSVISQAVRGIAELAKHDVVHCDIKPENVLLVNDDTTQAGNSLPASSVSAQTQAATLIRTQPQDKIEEVPPTNTTANETERPQAMPTSSPAGAQSAITNTQYNRIKLIDFGSACFKGQTMQTYIQSRFYRSPEVLVGLPYDSAIDVWSLGCVTAELFLGLPILPGVHEHDQLGRILEMISMLPGWMLDQGSKTSMFFNREPSFAFPQKNGSIGEAHPPTIPSLQNQTWRLKNQSEFIASLSEDEIRRKGGRVRLEKQHHSRYFKKKRLVDIVLHKGQSGTTKENKYDLDLFIHFLHGLLDPDPRKRWTALQASQHPFLTGSRIREHTEQTYVESRISGNLANLVGNLYWEPPSSFRGTGGKAYTISQLVGQHEGSRFGHRQTRNQVSERPQSTGNDDEVYARVPMYSDSQADLIQSFDRHRPAHMKNEKTTPFVPPPHASHSPFTAKTGGQNQSFAKGQIVLSQQTQQSDWLGHLGPRNGGKQGGDLARNVSPRIDSVQTHIFSSPVNPKCNQYG